VPTPRIADPSRRRPRPSMPPPTSSSPRRPAQKAIPPNPTTRGTHNNRHAHHAYTHTCTHSCTQPYARTHTPKPHAHANASGAPIHDALKGEEHDQVEFDQLRVVFLREALAQQVVQVHWDNVRPSLSFDEFLRTVDGLLLAEPLHQRRVGIVIGALVSFTIAVLYDLMLSSLKR
jgi:hypothetical protein